MHLTFTPPLPHPFEAAPLGQVGPFYSVSLCHPLDAAATLFKRKNKERKRRPCDKNCIASGPGRQVERCYEHATGRGPHNAGQRRGRRRSGPGPTGQDAARGCRPAGQAPATGAPSRSSTRPPARPTMCQKLHSLRPRPGRRQAARSRRFPHPNTISMARFHAAATLGAKVTP